MTARDRLSDVPVRARLAANRVRVGASNAWYRAAGRRISGTRQGIRNRIDRSTGRPNRDARAMGRLPDDSLARTASRFRGMQVVSAGRHPLAEDPRPRRDDRQLGRTADRSLARMAPARRADRPGRPARTRRGTR